MPATGPSLRSRTAQVNIRLDAPDADVLAALAFLRGGSAAEVLRPVIASFLEQQRSDPAVQAAIRARERTRRAYKQ